MTTMTSAGHVSIPFLSFPFLSSALLCWTLFLFLPLNRRSIGRFARFAWYRGIALFLSLMHSLTRREADFIILFKDARVFLVGALCHQQRNNDKFLITSFEFNNDGRRVERGSIYRSDPDDGFRRIIFSFFFSLSLRDATASRERASSRALS